MERAHKVDRAERAEIAEKDGGSSVIPKGKGGRRVLVAVMVAKVAERKIVVGALSEVAIVKKDYCRVASATNALRDSIKYDDTYKDLKDPSKTKELEAAMELVHKVKNGHRFYNNMINMDPASLRKAHNDDEVVDHVKKLLPLLKSKIALADTELLLLNKAHADRVGIAAAKAKASNNKTKEELN